VLRRVFTTARYTAIGVLGITLTALISYRLRFNPLGVSSLFLVCVALVALTGDFPAAGIVSLISVFSLDYFFVDPLFSFQVKDPINAVALLSFLVTALLITRLVLKVRSEARDAQVQRGRMERLYRLSWQLLAFEPESSMGNKLLEPFLGVFGSTTVCLFDADHAATYSVGEPRQDLEIRTRDAFILGKNLDERESRLAIRPLVMGTRMNGAIGFAGLEEPELTAGPLSTLATVMLARIHSFRNASEASAAVRTEEYRSAILDALAHEFKTPLATILAAAGGLREAGPLKTEQQEMADMVESEAARLGDLTSRLLRVARLEKDEVRPRLETIDVTDLATRVVEVFRRSSPDRRVSMAGKSDPAEAIADPELLRLALNQLAENACKYAPPGSSVTIAVERHPGVITVRVSNTGSSIASGERHRVFDRFYRGAAIRESSTGSGLGLYVARKIAVAHGGTLELENLGPSQNSVTFRLTIPSTPGKSQHAT